MTHQSHTISSESSALSDWLTEATRDGSHLTFDRDLIDWHVVAGRRMQAEAVAAALKALFARLLAGKRRHAKPDSAPKTAPGQAIQA